MSYGGIFGSLAITKRNKSANLPALQEFPSVSIVMSVFNDGEALENSLKRLIHLDYPNYEILIVYATKSTDNTEEVARKYADQYSFISVLPENISKGNACNIGIRNAKGEYILFLDSDTYVDNHYLLYTIPIFNKDARLACVQATSFGVNSTNPHTKLAWIALNFNTMTNEGVNRAFSSAIYSGYGGIWRKTALEDIGGFKIDSVNEDTDISCRFLAFKPYWRFQFDSHLSVYEYYPTSVKASYLAFYRWCRGTLTSYMQYIKYIFKTGSFCNSMALFVTGFYMVLGIASLFLIGIPVVQFFTTIVFHLPQSSNYGSVLFIFMAIMGVLTILLFFGYNYRKYKNYLSKRTIIQNAIIGIWIMCVFVGVCAINGVWDIIRRKPYGFVKTIKEIK
jgi:cellulose synthase/poly-beta-1,6-N-acetylglucosamine synthase-like glycosyltransferase